MTGLTRRNPDGAANFADADFESEMDKAYELLKLLMEPLGDYAPDIYHLALDYKVDGRDMNTQIVTNIHKGASDLDIIRLAVEFFKQNLRGELRAVTELQPETRYLWMTPDFHAELLAEAALKGGGV